MLRGEQGYQPGGDDDGKEPQLLIYLYTDIHTHLYLSIYRERERVRELGYVRMYVYVERGKWRRWSLAITWPPLHCQSVNLSPNPTWPLLLSESIYLYVPDKSICKTPFN